MRVGIMVPDLVANDAVGNDALGMYLALVRKGVEAYIFTQNGEAKSPLTVFHYDDADLLLSSPNDMLIYHYCIGDDLAMRLMRRITCLTVVKYHNVTPASFTMSYSNEYSRVSRLGREALVELRELPLAAIMSDSAFNDAELASIAAAGVTSVTVPPFHQIDQLLGLPDDSVMIGQITSRWLNILTVGRVVPNKGLDLMLASFGKAARGNARNVHLHLVGWRDPRLDGYLQQLEAIIQENGLTGQITWHGGVTPSQLATLYRHCDLFWTTSLHEGFCVPAIEAMAFSLPILASGHGALAETCGSAAVYADKEHTCVAALGRLIARDEERVLLGKAGHRRYIGNFRVSLIERRFHAALLQIRSNNDERVPAALLSVDGDWFDMPDAAALIQAALDVAEPMHPATFASRDRRLDFVDWILREGWLRSAEITQRLRSREFAEYAEDVELPAAAARLDVLVRLRWRFSRVANAHFDLRSPQDVSAFGRWCEQEAEGAYAFQSGVHA